MLLDIGFEIHTVTVLDPLQKSSNQLTAEKVVKSDLVLNCRKPPSSLTQSKPSSREDEGENGTARARIVDRVREILVDELSRQPGQTRARLWDIVLKRLLTRGELVEHRFEEILRSVADVAEGDRWYLKETYESFSQSDIVNEEAAGVALERFARLRMIGVPAQIAARLALDKPELGQPGDSSNGQLDEKRIEAYVQAHYWPKDSKKQFELGSNLRGIEFYDALFFYLTRYMKGKTAAQLPRRNLAEFLEDYLVHFRDSDKWLYRPPDGAEAAQLQRARLSGRGRSIRAFANALRERDWGALERRRPDSRTLVEHAPEFVIDPDRAKAELQPALEDVWRLYIPLYRNGMEHLLTASRSLGEAIALANSSNEFTVLENLSTGVTEAGNALAAARRQLQDADRGKLKKVYRIDDLEDKLRRGATLSDDQNQPLRLAHLRSRSETWLETSRRIEELPYQALLRVAEFLNSTGIRDKLACHDDITCIRALATQKTAHAIADHLLRLNPGEQRELAQHLKAILSDTKQVAVKLSDFRPSRELIWTDEDLESVVDDFRGWLAEQRPDKGVIRFLSTTSDIG